MLPVILAFIGVLDAFTPLAPPNLAYSTYLPGPTVAHSAVDNAGAQYFNFDSTSACDTAPSYAVAQPVVAVFVGRLEREGRTVTWITCLPGTSGGLAVDQTGVLYVATNSSGASTITKFAPDTFKPIYATTLSAASVAALALDRSGNVYATGSAGAGLRTTPGAYSAACSSSMCGFVARFGQTGDVGFVTYLRAKGNAIAVDSRGQAWITGTVSSPPGAAGGYSFAFVSKLNAEGSSVLFDKGFGGGVIGGVLPVSLYGGGLGISVDSEDAAYTVGYGTTNVPTTPGALQPSNPTRYSYRGYLVKFDPAGNLRYGTYLDALVAQGVAVDGSGNAYIAAWGNDRPPNTGNAACGWLSTSKLMAINSDGSQVLSSRLVGGWVLALARHASGAVYVSGYTHSTAFVASAAAYQPEFPRLGQSAFAAKVDFSQPSAPTLTCVVNAASQSAGRDASGFNGAVAPGEVVTLYGEMFNAGADAAVTFDGLPAPILYSGANRIDAVVPFRTGMQGDFTQLSIRLGSEVTGPYRLPVTRAVPGMFAALNQDGSVNSITHPAPAGSVVTVYGTGAGLYDREIEDGSPGPMEPPFP
ncbi:MAG: hypothetical protein JNN08_26190, partial [Bryobacterales bacterium]|nr:hypothetical protein [Bryobacterales bacterium]